VSADDATDDKWLDTILERAQEVSAIAERATAFLAAHPKYLSVPDAQTESEFITNAKRVYREAHNPTLKRGPRPKEAFAVNILAYLSRKRRRQLTKSELTKLLTNRRLLGADTLSKNTAEKYVRLFCLAGQDLESFSQQDKDWLRKEFGSESLSPEWWRDKMLGPWMSEGLRRSGLGEEIRKIFKEYTPTEVQQERDKLDAARDQLHEQYAKERRGSTKVQDRLAHTSDFDKKFFEHFLSGFP
jgi:hypothetical protein